MGARLILGLGFRALVGNGNGRKDQPIGLLRNYVFDHSGFRPKINGEARQNRKG